MKRLFFSVDVHGSTGLWRKWLSVPSFHKTDVLMLLGDLTGKMIVPLIRQPDGTYILRYWRREFHLKTEEEIREAEERLENSGLYPMRMDPEMVEHLKENPSEVEKLIKENILERIRKWMDLILEKVDLKKTEVYVMPGNDDIEEVDDIIKSYEDRGIKWPLGNVVEIEGHEMISCEYVNPTPWNTPRELPEPELKKHLKSLIEKLSNPSNSIFNFHCPPYNTKLDLAPQLDKKLKPVTVGGQVKFVHVGSKAVRELELEYQPVLGLHGHIHESGALDKLGKTMIINPGSEYEAGVLRGYIIEIDKEGVKNYYRVEG
ncbi:MAG: phosphoesterase [Thermoproteota archaeon]|jgi:Icc-related predicted phosphoesterase|uniref:Phosphoesterase n=1 Tax=Candidatus Methanodesulfokora washburnensis TaxID=2478471 RepID=A0A3R9QZ11_9CREN|nr:metallophosphoesterase [Candidatus Methanodesulfokores washburnensis]RSN76894.1 phosphoesterase [Candidatus Methanodesulfokores washburnensis]TDA37314.1 MAG: phosphoesterase [Candidatus Korarchaeota archaeon]